MEFYDYRDRAIRESSRGARSVKPLRRRSGVSGRAQFDSLTNIFRGVR